MHSYFTTTLTHCRSHISSLLTSADSSSTSNGTYSAANLSSFFPLKATKTRNLLLGSFLTAIRHTFLCYCDLILCHCDLIAFCRTTYASCCNRSRMNAWIGTCFALLKLETYYQWSWLPVIGIVEVGPYFSQGCSFKFIIYWYSWCFNCFYHIKCL